MRKGTLKCKCGQMMGIETVRDIVMCPSCRTQHTVIHIPHEVKQEAPQETEAEATVKKFKTLFDEALAKMMEGDPDGTND